MATVAPASLHMRAAARSRSPPLARRTPDRGQAAMWFPKGSCTISQRQRAAVRGRGMRSRRRSSTQKSEELSDSSGETGLATKMQADRSGNEDAGGMRPGL